jgi:serine/threonine protein kinase
MNPDPEQPVIGGRYEVRRTLGRGGMGLVLLAFDRRLETEVAIKMLPAELAADATVKEALIEALIKEAKIMARLTSDHIVRLFDLQDTAEGLFLVLEYVRGASLLDVLKTRPRLDIPEFLHVMRGVCAGLGVAHAHGIVHRDLKPANILLSGPFRPDTAVPVDLSTVQVKIADFGIAKALETASLSDRTRPVGTPAYMAPEQLRGEMPSVETDVYALGIMAYEMLSGQRPFPPSAPVHQRLLVNPIPLPGYPERLNQIIIRALARQRERRYSSAGAFLSALEGGLALAGDQTGRGSPWLGPKVASTPSGLIAISLTLLVVIASIATFLGDHGFSRFLSLGKTLRVQEIRYYPQALLKAFPPADIVAELPPALASASNPFSRVSPEEAIGPRNPRLAWTAMIAGGETMGGGSLKVKAVGADGTVFLHEQFGGGLCALRDRTPLWGLRADRGDLDVSPDGRIWVYGWDGAYCFNTLGQGGRLPARIRPWRRQGSTDEQVRQYRCASPDEGMWWGGDHRLDRFAVIPHSNRREEMWAQTLDQNCATNPEVTANGDVLVVTLLNTVYRIHPDGRLAWACRLPRKPERLYSRRNGDVLALCGTPDLYLIREGKLAWHYTADRDIGEAMIADKAGSVYVTQDFHNTGFTYQPDSRLYAIDRDGKLLWQRDVLKFHAQALSLDDRGRLYVTGKVGDGNGKTGILCFTE